MRGYELPSAGWEGWHMHSGKLWSPEGHGFTPDCQGWWHLLVRQARMFREMADRERQLNIAMHRTIAGPEDSVRGPGEAGAARVPRSMDEGVPVVKLLVTLHKRLTGDQKNGLTLKGSGGQSLVKGGV